MTNCLICGKLSPLPIRKTHKSDTRKYCSSKCTKTAYRLRHPDKDKESKQKWLKLNPEKRKESSSSYMKKEQSLL